MMDQSGMVVKPAPKKVDLHQKRETYPDPRQGSLGTKANKRREPYEGAGTKRLLDEVRTKAPGNKGE